MNIQEQIKLVVELIKNSKHTIALTGAGISTPSGIPDFRSPDCGLWNNVDPLDVSTISAFKTNPAKFYAFIEPLSQKIINALPNAAHIALANMEKIDFLKTVITQNVDNLHQKAGSKKVIELHGNGDTSHCLKCKKSYHSSELSSKLSSEKVPICDCGGIIKPNVILFGELLPSVPISNAYEEAKAAELMLVIGSSLTVVPAANLPTVTSNSGGKVVIFNAQPTFMDSAAIAVFRDRVEEILPQIVELL